MKRIGFLFFYEVVLSSLCLLLIVGIFYPYQQPVCEQYISPNINISMNDSSRYIAVTEASKPVEEDIFIPYDVPLSISTQQYVLEVGREYNVPVEIIYAIMCTESNYTANAISPTNDYGIMQINAMNHEWLSEVLGITDYLDEKQNILAGTYILSELQKQFDDVDQVVMAYNRGPTGARNLLEQGITEIPYTTKVMNKADELRMSENE